MFLVSRPSKRFSTSSLRTARGGQGRCGLPPARPPARPCPGGGQPHSLVHVERQGDVLVLGEKQDEEVVASLTLLDGRVQADLQGGRTDRVQRQPGLGDPAGELDGRGRQLPPEDPAGPSSPRRTSGAGPCGAAGRAAAPWCRGSCSRRSCRAGAGRWGRCGCRSGLGASGTAAPGRCRWHLPWPGSRPPSTARSGRRPAEAHAGHGAAGSWLQGYRGPLSTAESLTSTGSTPSSWVGGT